MLPKISIMLEFLKENFDLAHFSTTHPYEITLVPLSDDQQKNKSELGLPYPLHASRSSISRQSVAPPAPLPAPLL